MGVVGRVGRGPGKMGGQKKVLAFSVVLLALLAVSTLAPVSARDPFVGLPLGSGKRPRRGGELDCCNECKCNADMTSCTCEDGVTGGCSPGCQSCHRDHGHYYCRDILDGCPESCDYDYDGDGAPHGYSKMAAAGKM